MQNLKSFLILVLLATTISTSAQTKKTTTTAKKPTTTVKKTTTTAAKKTTTATKPAATTAAKKTTTAAKSTSTVRKTNTTAKKTTTTATKPATTTSDAKQEYKEGYNEGFEAGLRAAQNGVAKAPAQTTTSSTTETAKKKSSTSSKSPINLESINWGALSQRKTEGKNSMFLELQTIFDANGHGSDNHMYEFDFGYLRKSSDFFRTGFGVGAKGDFHFDHTPFHYIPMFWRSQITIPTNKDITPFINFDLGYVWALGSSIEDIDLEKGFIRVNPSIGCYFGNAYFGLGYLGEVNPVEHASFLNNVNLKFGLKLGDRPKSYRRFKSSYLTLDMSAGALFQTTPYKDYYYYSGEDQDLHTSTLSISVDLAWMFPIGKHFALGPSTGIRYVYTKESYNGSMDDPKFSTNDNIYIPLSVRGEYTFLNEDAAIRPYAGAELGVAVTSANNSLIAESPVFGLQGGIKINNKFRLGIGYTVNSVEHNHYDYDSSQTLNRLSAHFGIDF